MKNAQVNRIIETEGVVLTEQAIEQLRSFQENSNEQIRSSREVIADAICLLTLLLDHYEHEPTKLKAIRTITDLSYIREELESLKKP